MKSQNPFINLKTMALCLILAAFVCCKSNNTEEGNLGDKTVITETKVSIPDSITQFLLTSASSDFQNHQPPTVIDFRKLKVGYFTSDGDKVNFILCGEFLSQENKEKKKWETFATIKTSGYEQNIGDQTLSWCQKATFISGNTNLSLELKNQLGRLSEQK